MNAADVALADRLAEMAGSLLALAGTAIVQRGVDVNRIDQAVHRSGPTDVVVDLVVDRTAVYRVTISATRKGGDEPWRFAKVGSWSTAGLRAVGLAAMADDLERRRAEVQAERAKA